MTMRDSRGLPVSNGTAASLEGLEKASELFLGYYADPLAAIESVLAEDPDFAMGLCFKAGMFMSSSEKGAVPELQAIADRLEGMRGHLNQRELGHLAAIRLWLAGDFHTAVDAYGCVLTQFPRDIVALQAAHLCDFLLGQSRMLRDRVEWVLPHWDEAVPGFGYVLGMSAFGLEETALYGEAEAAGRRALALNPRDPWAVHAVAHVMEMQGRVDEGIAWLRGRQDDWAPENLFAFHNWWHLCLYLMERGRFDEVLELYDSSVHPAPTQVALELVDAAALLWRLHLQDKPVGARWSDVADSYEPMAEDAYYAFNDMHAMMAFVADGREAAASRLLKAVRAKAGDRDSNGMMTREVGLPACEAIHAFGQADYRRTVELLMPARLVAHRFGGSHAQRDIIEWTLTEAALRDGQRGLAQALAHERLARKPQSPLAASFLGRANEANGAGGANSREDRAVA